MLQRVKKLRAKLAEKSLEAFLVCQIDNCRYLSGFTGSNSWLLISERSAILATDFRYAEQAKKEAPGFEIAQIKGGLSEWFPKMTSDLGLKKVGVEADHLTLTTYRQLTEANKGQVQLQLIPTTNLVESLRAIKEPEEIELLSKAAQLADAALEYARSIIRPEVSEKEMAWELEKFLREKGSEPVPFHIIVASGTNSALPHARPSEKILVPGEPIIIDLGVRIEGYCGDLSRTLYLGKEDATFAKIFDIVLGAQLSATALIKSEMTGSQADSLARTIIEEAGYGNTFGHGLGHGIGLAPHEAPRLGINSQDTLAENMVFTVEPGIYVNGWGGVRIEDMAVIEKGKVRILTQVEKSY